MILFRPDGTEVTRLPGEADLDRYMQALSLGMTAAHPVRQTLATALKNGASLTPDEWRLLADYSWDTDGALPVAADRVAETLQSLAQRARAAREGRIGAFCAEVGRGRRVRRSGAGRRARQGGACRFVAHGAAGSGVVAR